VQAAEVIQKKIVVFLFAYGSNSKEMDHLPV
jgi:hypothetical protein